MNTDSLNAQIEQAVAHLEAQGQRPTTRLVRKILGRRTGPVNRELRKFLNERAVAAAPRLEMPEEVKATFERGLVSLVSACDRFIQDRLAVLERSASARVAEADSDADAAIDAEEAMQEERDRLVSGLQEAQERIASLQRDQTALQAQLQEKARQVDDLKEILKAERGRAPKQTQSRRKAP